MRYRGIVAWIVFFCVLAGLLTGEALLIIHADHGCTGEACPICAQMKGASDVLRRILEGLLKAVAQNHQGLPLLSASMFLLIFFRMREQTLITAKVRLND
jgi:hypothetical protein